MNCANSVSSTDDRQTQTVVNATMHWEERGRDETSTLSCHVTSCRVVYYSAVYLCMQLHCQSRDL